MPSTIQATALFDKVRTALTATGLDDKARLKLLHESLVLCCHAGTQDEPQSFGNLFSRVDFLCKKHGVKTADKVAIQEARRHSNQSHIDSADDLRYDARAVSLFISAVLDAPIPHELLLCLPPTLRPYERRPPVDHRRLRCIVSHVASPYLAVTPDEGEALYAVALTDPAHGIDHTYLCALVRGGTQVNLLDCRTEERSTLVGNEVCDKTITPRLIVLEPDFLLDISSIAACFTDIGHHPLLYLVNEMRPHASTQATLLGNYASAALDDCIHSPRLTPGDTLRGNFLDRALDYCGCADFNAPQFHTDMQAQTTHLRQAVDVLFAQYPRDKAILEPSFICESLGIQGRVDLMTTDCHLLVEQKSGKNWNIASHRPDPRYHSYQLPAHFVQLLLYYGVLRYNFHLVGDEVDIRLLYSKYPAQQGLMVVAYYHDLFLEAITYRNQVVATLLGIAREGFQSVLPDFCPESLNVAGCQSTFYQRYLLPQLREVIDPVHSLTTLERAYFCRMVTSVIREQVMQKMGGQEGIANSNADLWSMPLSEKREAGIIYTGLTLVARGRSDTSRGYDILTLRIPPQGIADFLPNFRQGDMVWLYAYPQDAEPDVRSGILHRGTVQSLTDDTVTVLLGNAQQNPQVFGTGPFALEHAHTDTGTAAMLRSLHQFIRSPRPCRDLLLGQRPPVADTSLTLSRSYDPRLDPILLRAKQARDYFLLMGPPGTGKTSRALHFIVQESLACGESILLMSYTNRAVDEICGMLVAHSLPFVRIGNALSCEERFRPYLFSQLAAAHPRLDTLRAALARIPIIVGTVSSVSARPELLQQKLFHLAVIDEASQVLEPSLVGLLTQVGRFILIGDYKQLPAVVQQSAGDTAIATDADGQLLRAICLTDCRQSLFERLLLWERHCGRTSFIGTLRWQGRMHPAVARFPVRHFYARERLEPVPCPHQLESSLPYPQSAADPLDGMLLAHRMLFIASRDCRQPGLSDKVNTHEAEIVADVLTRLYHYLGPRFDAQTSVGIIVPYRNQISMIRHHLLSTGIPQLAAVTIDTVERYQGSQRDVIIYSFTVQNDWQLEFLTANTFQEDAYTIDRKLNVAMTRARRQMILTGNPQVLSRNPLFRQLITYCQRQSAYIPADNE